MNATTLLPDAGLHSRFSMCLPRGSRVGTRITVEYACQEGLISKRDTTDENGRRLATSVRVISMSMIRNPPRPGRRPALVVELGGWQP